MRQISILDYLNQRRITTWNLAPEASLALDQFLKTLNKFFDDIEDIDDKDIQPMTLIKWYTTCALSNGEYAHAKSLHYNVPFFDNVAINMTNNEHEEMSFFTNNGICYGKVSLRLILLPDNYTYNFFYFNR
jgi:hypothetical protein